ncbi:carbohydrate kinase family protein [uncultured Fibrella sp.]|uniref:carbohydrate kinase family protein n=1 Tax=uncultured Fibrella sp. TaxID=1284596 RepID=UPI0035CA833C
MILTSKQLILSVGELLADFIGQTFSESLFDAADFTRFQGGSPANMAANMARLGNQAALVACVGDDNLGRYLVQKVAETGIDVSHIHVQSTQPTSLVVVSRTKGTPDFIAYRTADCLIQPEHLPDQLLDQTALFHTTCFALSRNPAQTTIVDAARRASIAGAQISIDANYAPSIWPDRDNAWQVLGDYCASGALVKLSEDDAERLYGAPQTPEQIRTDFHRMGAKLVCLTLGAEGSIVSTDNGGSVVQMPGKPLSVVDATGAGDAYWAGFLTAWLDGCTPAECAAAGANLAALKLIRRGSLPPTVDRKVLYEL